MARRLPPRPPGPGGPGGRRPRPGVGNRPAGPRPGRPGPGAEGSDISRPRRSSGPRPDRADGPSRPRRPSGPHAGGRDDYQGSDRPRTRRPSADRPSSDDRERPRRAQPAGDSAGPGPGSAPRPKLAAGTGSKKPFTPEPPSAPTGPERLQKVLAAAGFGSRRSCEELILQGRVSVNNTTIKELGTKVALEDRIEVDGQRIEREKLVYLLVNKPRGYVSTSADPSGRPQVVDLVTAVPQRVYTVGRLDEDSTGLMILTNDGELANKLAHPKYGVEKVYRAVVAGHPSPDIITKLTEGVWLSDGKARARRVRVVGQVGDSTQIEMVLAEGKNREVRRMWAKLGHKVMRLNRVAIGPLSLKGLKPGAWRNLTSEELNELRRLAAGKKVDTAWFDERETSRRESKPRRGAAKHEYEAAARNPRTNVADATDTEKPSARTGVPRGPGSATNKARPSGPRGESEGAGTGAGPRGPRSDRQGAGTGAGAGPRGTRPAGPRDDRGPAGPREGRGDRDRDRDRDRGSRGPADRRGPGSKLRGPAADRGRHGIPQDSGLVGPPRRNARHDDDGDDDDIEISLPPSYGADVPGAHAALPPSKRPKGPSAAPRPAGPGAGKSRPEPKAERLPVKRSSERTNFNKDPELGIRRVIGLDAEDSAPSRPAEARRDRPGAKRVRPVSKPRRTRPGDDD